MTIKVAMEWKVAMGSIRFENDVTKVLENKWKAGINTL
jgi:hypothetical protein